MKFSPFDLDHHITRHNLYEDTTLKRNEFDFLRALSPESIRAYKSALDLFKHSRNLGAESFSSKEATFLTTVIKQLYDKDYQSAHFSVYQLNEIPKLNNISSWHLEQQKQLKNAGLWNDILSKQKSSREKSQLLPLKQQWLSDETHYASHNVNALWFVANNIADFFEQYHYYAAAEYLQHRRKISKIIASDYGEYLEHEKKKLIEFRIELSQVMLTRLQLAAATNNITYGDHIHYTTQFLHNSGLFTQDFDIPKPQSNDLSPEYFQKFIEYILKNGNEAQRLSLCNLGIFTCDDEYIAWRNKKSMILVPASFYKRRLVPDSEPWFPGIFVYRNFRYQFMEKNVWLFSSIRSLSKHPIEIDRISDILTHLKSLEDKLQTSNNEMLDKNFSGLQKFFHYYTALFTLEWSSYFTESNIDITKKKISILEKILGHYEHKKTLDVDIKIIFQIINEISRSIHTTTISQEDCERFYVVKSKLLEIKKSISTQTPKKEDLKKLQDLTVLPHKNQSYNPFGEQKIDQKSTESPLSTNPFDEICNTQTKVDSSLFELIKTIKLMELDNGNFDEILLGIKNTMQSTIKDNSPDKQEALEVANNELFTQLIRHCAGIKTFAEYEKYHKKYLAIEELLSKYSPEHISSRIKDLASLRSKGNFWFLYQLKCRSYISSFDKGINKVAQNIIAHSAVFNSQPPEKLIEPCAPHEKLNN